MSVATVLKTRDLVSGGLSGPCPVHSLHEFSIRVSAQILPRLRDFYREVIGLEHESELAPSGVEIRLYASGTRVLRLAAVPEAGTWPRVHDRHRPAECVAIALTGLRAALERLRTRGVSHRMRVDRVRRSVTLMLHDPFGVRVELTFRAESEGPERWLIQGLCAWGDEL